MQSYREEHLLANWALSQPLGKQQLGTSSTDRGQMRHPQVWLAAVWGMPCSSRWVLFTAEQARRWKRKTCWWGNRNSYVVNMLKWDYPHELLNNLMSHWMKATRTLTSTDKSPIDNCSNITLKGIYKQKQS